VTSLLRFNLVPLALALALAVSTTACSEDPAQAAPQLTCPMEVSAGDHTSTCQGLTFLTMVDASCVKGGCGLIVDVHGGTMSALQMRDNTLLHQLAPKKGFIVLHPSATPEKTGGTWNSDQYPAVASFVKDVITAYKVDEDRVHVTGFSQGGLMTWWFLCNYPQLLASAAPAAAAFQENSCFDASWQPRAPILYMNGINDRISLIDQARDMVATMNSSLMLTGGEQIAGDGHYSRKHWQDADGMALDFIEHDYGGQAVLDGHCIPGGIDVPGAANSTPLNATTCTTGDIKLNWGETVLQWFIDHPRKH
jgi:polyhydroxybutyrate depolymerase